jgi:hypothetical protein
MEPVSALQAFLDAMGVVGVMLFCVIVGLGIDYYNKRRGIR